MSRATQITLEWLIGDTEALNQTWLSELHRIIDLHGLLLIQRFIDSREEELALIGRKDIADATPDQILRGTVQQPRIRRHDLGVRSIAIENQDQIFHRRKQCAQLRLGFFQTENLPPGGDHDREDYGGFDPLAESMTTPDFAIVSEPEGCHSKSEKATKPAICEHSNSD